MLKQVAQRGCELCEGVHGQAGWGPGQPDLIGGSPALSRGLELDYL